MAGILRKNILNPIDLAIPTESSHKILRGPIGAPQRDSLLVLDEDADRDEARLVCLDRDDVPSGWTRCHRGRWRVA